MIGVSAQTGLRLDGLAHLRQSVRDILTTPVGTRVLRRDYGSRLFELVDAPSNAGLAAAIAAEAADALGRWEPRLEVERIELTDAGEGMLGLLVSGTHLPDGRQVRIAA